MMNLVGSALQGNASDAPPRQGPYEVRERLRALKIALNSQILNGKTFQFCTYHETRALGVQYHRRDDVKDSDSSSLIFASFHP